MGNLTEELALEKYMPATFKSFCPICKEDWKREIIDFYGPRTSLECAKNCFHFSKSGHFVSNQMDTAWRKLWRSFVQTYGLKKAIELAS